MHPTELQRDGEHALIIAWSDGLRQRFAASKLREACPCASCREKRNAPANPMALNVLSPEEAKPVGIEAMRPVGNYAYGIRFTDGHDTGIFTFERLRELGETMES